MARRSPGSSCRALEIFPRALPWLIRYLSAAWTYPQVERTAQGLRSLLKGAPELHQDMAQQAGVPELIERRGLLHAFLSREEFQKDARAWAIRKKEGIAWKSWMRRHYAN